MVDIKDGISSCIYMIIFNTKYLNKTNNTCTVVCTVCTYNSIIYKHFNITKMVRTYCMNDLILFNPFTLKSFSRSIVCYVHTFGNNLGIKLKFAKYFKESCCLSSDQHFSFKCFQKNAFVRKIFPKSSGLFWPL